MLGGPLPTYILNVEEEMSHRSALRLMFAYAIEPFRQLLECCALRPSSLLHLGLLQFSLVLQVR